MSTQDSSEGGSKKRKISKEDGNGDKDDIAPPPSSTIAGDIEWTPHLLATMRSLRFGEDGLLILSKDQDIVGVAQCVMTAFTLDWTNGYITDHFQKRRLAARIPKTLRMCAHVEGELSCMEEAGGDLVDFINNDDMSKGEPGLGFGYEWEMVHGRKRAKMSLTIDVCDGDNDEIVQRAKKRAKRSATNEVDKEEIEDQEWDMICIEIKEQ